MKGTYTLFYFVLGLIGFLLTVITMLVILIQFGMEFNLFLILFCAVSWVLFLFAAYEISRLKE
jgi:hypothetical protein